MIVKIFEEFDGEIVGEISILLFLREEILLNDSFFDIDVIRVE